MFKCLQMLFFAFCAVLLVSGCSSALSKKDTKTVSAAPERFSESVVIEPSRSYEACTELYPEQIMEYSFKASMPVDFNIHYHGEDKIHYPVSQKMIFTSQGTLTPEEHTFYTKEQEYFCLMWDNPHHHMNVSLTFEYMVKPKGRQ